MVYRVQQNSITENRFLQLQYVKFYPNKLLPRQQFSCSFQGAKNILFLQEKRKTIYFIFTNFLTFALKNKINRI